MIKGRARVKEKKYSITTASDRWDLPLEKKEKNL